jgi:hypothetical protein
MKRAPITLTGPEKGFSSYQLLPGIIGHDPEAHHGDGCAPGSVAPVQETALGLGPAGRHALQQIAPCVKLLGQHFSLRYPEAWLICAPNPLIWEVEAEV